MKKEKRITFFGSSEIKPEEKDYKNAYQSARLLAKEGFVIVNGAGPGIMKASSEGAKSVGGKTIGVAFDPKGMTKFEGRDQTNPVDEEIIAPSYWERTLKLWQLGDVYVFFNGGTGTISEFGMAWGLARLFFSQHKSLILFGNWWYDITESFGRNMRLRPEELQVYRIVNTPDGVLKEVIDLIGRPNK